MRHTFQLGRLRKELIVLISRERFTAIFCETTGFVVVLKVIYKPGNIQMNLIIYKNIKVVLNWVATDLVDHIIIAGFPSSFFIAKLLIDS